MIRQITVIFAVFSVNGPLFAGPPITGRTVEGNLMPFHPTPELLTPQNPGPAPLPIGPGVPPPSPLPRIAPSALPVGPIASPALTLKQFEEVFRPIAGTHNVTFIHPVTKCPVPVCFHLPCGCPKVRVNRRSIVFDYGRHEVEIIFRLFGGRIDVRYD